MDAKGTAKLAVEVIAGRCLQHLSARGGAVFGRAGRVLRLLHEAHHGAVREQPHADVHEQQVGRGQGSLLFGPWLLEHEVEFAGPFAAHGKHPVV